MGNSVPMNIAKYLKAAMALDREISVLLRADHGLGKSSVERQLHAMILERDLAVLKAATPEGKEVFEFIDRRLSQMSEGDMIGLPSTDGETTRFNPPDWFKRACVRPCFLFLDELNRATPEVMQAAFQIVLDRELNGWRLHPLSRVSTAINTGASYSVNEMDPALVDRFFVVDLVPTVADWIRWAQDRCIIRGHRKFGRQNVHEVVTEFIRTNERFLDTPKDADPQGVHTSRRSWERVSDNLVSAGVIDTPDDSLFHLLTMGFVGVEASIALREFAKNFDNKLSGEDILQRYHTKKVQEKMKRQGTEALNSAIDKVVDYVHGHLTVLDDRQGNNLQAFMKDLSGELRIACWGKLTRDGIEKLDLATSIHKWCAATMLEVFGVPMGEAGIGVVPDIPGIFKKEK